MLDEFVNKMIQELWKDFDEAIEHGAQNLIMIFLKIMKIVLKFSPEYRKNIENFEARYQFLSGDGNLKVSAEFHHGKLEVEESIIKDPNVIIIFRDGRSLLNFLFSPKPDILGSMLNHNLQTRGNLNYVYKLGYMANHMRLMLAP